MFKFIRNSDKNETVVAEKEKPSIQKVKTGIVEEIHETFFTEVDRLLASAKISNSVETDKQELIDKGGRLLSIGFKNSKEVKEAEVEIDRLNKLKKENEEKLDLIEAINFFSVVYPTYKFITEDSVKKICEKYGLVYGDIGKYLGTVPDKNLKHIEQFKVIEDHECYQEYTHSYISGSRVGFKYISKGLYEYNQNESKNNLYLSFHYREVNEKCPLEIAAPIKDFDMKGLEVKDYKLRKIEVPDPVVLKPIFFKGKKHYLIVTAWGEEAIDEIVVNQQMN